MPITQRCPYNVAVTSKTGSAKVIKYGTEVKISHLVVRPYQVSFTVSDQSGLETVITYDDISEAREDGWKI